MAVFLRAALWVLLLLCPLSHAAVVLQYHHVSDDTPASTSVSVGQLAQHLDWLHDNGFSIIAVTELLGLLARGELDPRAKIAAITFDDAGRSVCDHAWPLLQQRQLPFMLFVSTDIIQAAPTTQCSWSQLKTMVDSGLMEVGNHGHTHMHMANRREFDNQDAWITAITHEVTRAQEIIDKALGKQPRVFAYPYGETSRQVEDVVGRLGYKAFGQHSGAVGPLSDTRLLPRYPLSGRYATMELFPLKMMTLPLPVKTLVVSDLDEDGLPEANPPKMDIELAETLAHNVRCFLGTGEPVTTIQRDRRVIVYAPEPLPAGRHRYNCTAASGNEGRFYWFSYQWVL